MSIIHYDSSMTHFSLKKCKKLHNAGKRIREEVSGNKHMGKYKQITNLNRVQRSDRVVDILEFHRLIVPFKQLRLVQFEKQRRQSHRGIRIDLETEFNQCNVLTQLHVPIF